MPFTRQQMLAMMDGLIDELGAIRTTFEKDGARWTPAFSAWQSATEVALEAIFGATSMAIRTFREITYSAPLDPNATPQQREAAEMVWYGAGLYQAWTRLVGFRYVVDRLAVDPPTRPNPLIFVSHGGPVRTHVDATKELLTVVGLVPIVVEDMPSYGMSVNEKVRRYIGICTAAIILATEDEEIIAPEARTRPNIENEVGMLQNALNIANRIVYLKEPGVKFATNYAEKVWITFTKERVQDSFIPMLRELRSLLAMRSP
jgi:hypothetical protein